MTIRVVVDEAIDILTISWCEGDYAFENIGG